MKQFNLKQFALMLLGVLLISATTMSCSKNVSKPDTVATIKDYGTHSIDPQLQGQWMWTLADPGYEIGRYDAEGTWTGSGHGFAFRLSIDSKGNGVLFDHTMEDFGDGNYTGIDIYYKGYYELDSDGALWFYPMMGTYTNTEGANRILSSDELYNADTGEGTKFNFGVISLTSDKGLEAFSSTSGGVTDFYYKQ